MPIGSPSLFRLNLATPDSSMPLIMRLLSVANRLACLESCREESINGIKEHANVIKLPRKNDDILLILVLLYLSFTHNVYVRFYK